MESVYNVALDGKVVAIKRLEKVFDATGVTKAEIIAYYQSAAPLILPHITQKPFSMIHFPDGVGGKSFYQKRKPVNAPEWLDTATLKSIEFCLVNDSAAMIYMANRGVVEMHTFFSRLNSLDSPDIAVIDLDPSGKSSFADAALTALAFETLLSELKLFSVPKTSGSSGIHIYIPIKNADFGQVQSFLGSLCRIVEAEYPQICTTERTISKRGNKIYLDYLQNGYGKTIACPYSLRAVNGFNFSAPLLWDELKNPDLKPSDFTIRNFDSRLKKTGDLFADFYKKVQNLPSL